MGSLQPKRKKGNDYWYWMKTERVDGEPRITQQVYLGTADRILAAILAYKALPLTPFRSFEFGMAAALLSSADDLGLLEAVDAATDKSRHNGLSVGQHLLLMVAGRCGRPLSKLKISENFDTSYLKLLWNAKGSLSCQTILDHMDRVNEDAMRSIEDHLAKALVERGVSPKRLIFDTTNMVTNIEHGEELPRKGHSKQRRYDKNLLGLALAVGEDNVPILHETFPGNESDMTVFPRVIEDARSRLAMAGAHTENLIVIFDKGNNSEENFDTLPKDLRLVGSLKRNQVDDLMHVPLSEYKLLYTNRKKHDVLGFRTTQVHFGREWTVVVQYNEATFRKNERSYGRELERSLRNLKHIQEQLKKPPGKGRPLKEQGLAKKIVDALPENHTKAVDWDVKSEEIEFRGRKRTRWDLTFSVNDEQDKYYRRGFGKTAVFTDCHEWSSEETVRTYNSKYLIEDDFKWLKNKLLVCVTPVYHRRDDRIRVHVFSCVLGLLLVRYTAWKLRDLGLPASKLFEKLEGIRVAIVKENATGETSFRVEQMDAVQSTIFTRLGLDRYVIR
jgi:transposase